MSISDRQFMSAGEYGRTLAGLSLNLIVRDVARSTPFYTQVLGFRVLHQTADYAALERDGATIQLHADRTYSRQPWGSEPLAPIGDDRYRIGAPHGPETLELRDPLDGVAITAVVSGATYRYRLRANSAAGNSPYSNIARAKAR